MGLSSLYVCRPPIFFIYKCLSSLCIELNFRQHDNWWASIVGFSFYFYAKYTNRLLSYSFLCKFCACISTLWMYAVHKGLKVKQIEIFPLHAVSVCEMSLSNIRKFHSFMPHAVVLILLEIYWALSIYPSLCFHLSAYNTLCLLWIAS